jgi:NAD(P)-dependent dehydrogenase (short-subunit alcohol dehydrogenase family)
MDVRDEKSVADGIAAASDALGGIDVLVNNAGIGMRTVNPRFMTDPQPFWIVEPDRFRDLFATNVTGYLLLARAVAPVMAQAGKGCPLERPRVLDTHHERVPRFQLHHHEPRGL